MKVKDKNPKKKFFLLAELIQLPLLLIVEQLEIRAKIAYPSYT